MVKQAEKTRRKSALLPAMGMVMAITLGVLSYFLAPILLDLAREQSAELNTKLADETKLIETPAGYFEQLILVEVAVGVLLWLTLFGLSMVIVSITLGEDPAYEDRLVKPKRNASDKEWERYQKKYKQVEERRQRQAEAKQKREEQERRRR